METLSLIALAVSAATLVVTILIAIRLKTVHYLLQQPVVKKMSPQLRLKPVKLDEAMNRNRDRQGAPGGERREGRPEGDRREGGRPEGRDGRRDGGRDGRRDGGRPEGERREGGRPEGRERREGGRPEGERREGGRPEGRDGRERREGGRPEGERREGGRPEGRERREGGRPEGREGREGRPEGERRERRDGDRPENREARPPREFNDAPRGETPVVEASRPAPEAPAGLPARRPLNSFSETPVARSESASSALSTNEPVDATFVGSGDDVQHGRRTQLKKKPRFDVEEEPATPAV